jgi:hypothetical protein
MHFRIGHCAANVTASVKMFCTSAGNREQPHAVVVEKKHATSAGKEKRLERLSRRAQKKINGPSLDWTRIA